jgi:hypothetical protein
LYDEKGIEISNPKHQVGQMYDVVFGGKYGIHMALTGCLTSALQLLAVSVHKPVINYHAVMHGPLKGTAVGSLQLHSLLLVTDATDVL